MTERQIESYLAARDAIRRIRRTTPLVLSSTLARPSERPGGLPASS